MENPSLLVNLVFALGAALIGGALAVRLRQSVILGYILAGVAIGPFTPGFVADIAAVEALADIGVIFLMFAIGVQISLRELLAAGPVAIIGGAIQILLTIGLGYLAGMGLGWQPLQALFFGAAISLSSTAVLSKVLDERGEAGTEHGRLALAWSAVQDFATIVLVVLFSTLATDSGSFLPDLLWDLGRAAFFLVLFASLGTLALPWFFERVAALRNREVFVLTVAAVALGMAYASFLFGLSLALGAFIAGIVVSESDLSHRILGEIMPLRDIFAGLFFVSVGILVDPHFVAGHPLFVLLTLLLIVVVKGLLTTTIVALARYSARTALLTGVVLAQSAEFSFLIARLGMDVGALTPAAFNLILSGAAVSIVIAPFLPRAASPFAAWAERLLPLPLPALNPEREESPERGHAVICGYGRVGRVIGSALFRRGFPFVVIEEDPRIVRQLRAQGVPAFLGNAANPVILERVNLKRARVLVVAIPDPVAVRQIVDYARSVNPNLDIVVRTHSETERAFLQRRGVNEAVMGEQELALEMTRHTLHRFGVSGLEVQAIIRGLRERGEALETTEWS